MTRMSLALAVLALTGTLVQLLPAPCHASEVAAIQGPRELVYRVTIRDFLPAMCYGATKSLRDQWNDVWGRVPGSRISFALAVRCPFRRLIADGTLVPHLDFQAANFQLGFPANEGKSVAFRGFGRGAISEIAGSGLVARDNSGLLKASYCTSNATDFCGKPQLDTRVPVTSGLESFKLWFMDDRRTNRRVGTKLILTDVEGDGTFTYDSGFFFDPLSHVPHVDPTDTDPDNALRWDKRQMVQALGCGSTCPASNNYPFYLTTELHTFFQYRGGEVFTFSGDDDVFVYINEMLAIDIGGIHPEVSATVALDDLADVLQLQINGTYSLDLFHAERHTGQSNFRLTSTLVSACNVLQSGTTSVMFPPSALDSNADVDIPWLTSRGASVDGRRGVITLTDGSSYSASEFVYHPVQQNVGAGFVLEFDFVFPDRRTAFSDGFAFVMHSAPDGLDDLPTSSSGNLGFRFLRNSAVIALDMCPDRPNCATNTQRLSLHYVTVNETGSRFNDASDRTRQRAAVVPNPLNKGQTHTLRAVYYENPSYLEVYIDDSLYLVDKAFNPQMILGGRDAYVGFTTGTSAKYAAGVKFTRWQMDTVAVSVQATTALGSLTVGGDSVGADKPVLIADGRAETEFVVATFDKCGNGMDGGGLKGLLSATMVVPPTRTGASTLLSSSVPGGIVANTAESESDQNSVYYNNTAYGNVTISPTRIVDKLDGTYALVFSTVFHQEAHDLYVKFGDGCAEGDDAFATYEQNVVLMEQGDACWAAAFVDVLDTQQQPTVSPTYTGFVRETVAPTPGPADWTAILGLGSTGMALGMSGVFLGLGLLFYRRRWKRDQVHVGRGRMAQLEAEIEYQPDVEMAALRRQYQTVKQTVLRERARGLASKNRVRDISALERQMQDIKEHMRFLKEKSQLASDGISSRPVSGAIAPKRRLQFLPTNASFGSKSSFRSTTSSSSSSTAKASGKAASAPRSPMSSVRSLGSVRVSRSPGGPLMSSPPRVGRQQRRGLSRRLLKSTNKRGAVHNFVVPDKSFPSFAVATPADAQSWSLQEVSIPSRNRRGGGAGAGHELPPPPPLLPRQSTTSSSSLASIPPPPPTMTSPSQAQTVWDTISTWWNSITGGGDLEPCPADEPLSPPPPPPLEIEMEPELQPMSVVRTLSRGAFGIQTHKRAKGNKRRQKHDRDT